MNLRGAANPRRVLRCRLAPGPDQWSICVTLDRAIRRPTSRTIASTARDADGTRPATTSASACALRLDLNEDGTYSGRFIPAAGRMFTDLFTGRCH